MRRSTPTRRHPGLSDRTDAHLLRLAREGDRHAYEAIVARYREPLRRACARIVPDRAEDAVQQALLSAWIALERGADVRDLRPWLYSIARNAAIDQARGVRTDAIELGPEVPGGEDPAQAEARRREVSEVLEAVAALPERQRRALVDTAVHGRATEAVAVDLGLSGGALRQLVHRARTTVRAAVPSVAFPIPAWLAEWLGEEGTRRGAMLLGSGSGAAMVAKTTATVATLGAVVAGGLTVDDRVTPQPGAASARSAVSSTARAARSGEPSGVAAAAPAFLVATTLLPAASAQPTSTIGAASAADPRTRRRRAASDATVRHARHGRSGPAALPGLLGDDDLDLRTPASGRDRRSTAGEGDQRPRRADRRDDDGGGDSRRRRSRAEDAPVVLDDAVGTPRPEGRRRPPALEGDDGATGTAPGETSDGSGSGTSGSGTSGSGTSGTSRPASDQTAEPVTDPSATAPTSSDDGPTSATSRDNSSPAPS